MKKSVLSLSLLFSMSLLTLNAEEPAQPKKENWLDVIRDRAEKAWTDIEQTAEKSLREVKTHVDNLFERDKDVEKQLANIKKRKAVLENVKQQLETPQAKAHPDQAAAHKAVVKAIAEHDKAQKAVEKTHDDLHKQIQALKDKVAQAAETVKQAHDKTTEDGKKALEEAHKVLKDVKLEEPKKAPMPVQAQVQKNAPVANAKK